ncbi:MAG: hypothetical protein IKF82_02425 [Bacilli bacterium]|nr:hypothetical protein [Bacilli bacterium]
MYKYQEETIEEIDNAIAKIENMTEEHYRVHIGFRHTHEFENENIPIYVEVNGTSRFTQQTMMDSAYDMFSRCEICNHNRVELLNDIFLEINKLIDKVIEDNKKREKFHQKLNKELEALNKSL